MARAPRSYEQPYRGLPSEVLTKIFEYLPLKDRLNAVVLSQWTQACARASHHDVAATLKTSQQRQQLEDCFRGIGFLGVRLGYGIKRLAITGADSQLPPLALDKFLFFVSRVECLQLQRVCLELPPAPAPGNNAFIGLPSLAGLTSLSLDSAGWVPQIRPSTGMPVRSARNRGGSKISCEHRHAAA